MELSQDERKLLMAAVDAAKNAYAPYSKFNVGAAILTRSGKIFTGCNVENASYGLTTCAERVAVFKAVSEAEMHIDTLALTSEGGATPCGSCRQVLFEFNPKLRIIVGDAEGRLVGRKSLAELLPDAFGPNFKKE